MAWIEFHPDVIVELKKFEEFRRELSWTSNETLGFLGRFWGKVLKLRESGEISDWTAEYIAGLTQASASPERLYKAMKGRWIEEKNGTTVVHDWMRYAGRYLKKKYGGAGDRRELSRIYRLHGLRLKRASSEDPPTVPDRTKPNQKKRPLDSRENDSTEEKALLAMPWKIPGKYYLWAVRDLPPDYCGWALKGGLSEIGPEYRRALQMRIDMKLAEAIH